MFISRVRSGRLNSDFSMKDVDALCKDLDRGWVKGLGASGSGGDGKVSHKEFLHWLKADNEMTQAPFNDVQRHSLRQAVTRAILRCSLGRLSDMNCLQMARETGGARDERIKKVRSGHTPSYCHYPPWYRVVCPSL